jgi:hypothetical protein
MTNGQNVISPVFVSRDALCWRASAMTLHMNPRWAVVYLSLILGCSSAFPCTCAGPHNTKTMREVAEWYATRPDVALVFEGKVVKQEIRNGSIGGPSTAMSMTLEGKHRVVEFDVTQVFRGTHQQHLSMVTGLGTGDCGYVFWPGESYLVYATSWPGGIWFTSICSGTAEIEDAGAAIRFLAGEKPKDEDVVPLQDYRKHYYEEVLPKRTGALCGQVMKPDGTPLKGAEVELWELRNDNLPPRGGSDPNTSTDTGHFCVANVPPGEYFLSAESEDYDNGARFMGYYPGVYSQAEAKKLTVQRGVHSPDVKFTTFHERLYTIRIRVVTSDGTPVSYKNGCGVAVDSELRDPLSYHIDHTLDEDGSYTFGYIPRGEYIVTTYFQPDLEGSEPRPFAEASKWKPARQEVLVRGDTDVLVQLEPAHPK